MKRRILFLIFTLISIVLASCSTPPPSISQTDQKPVIQLNNIKTESKEITIDPIDQYNCNGDAEAENLVEKSRAIQFVLETQNNVSINGKGQVGFAGTDVELGAEVSRTFGQSYGVTETISRGVVVKANPHTHVKHLIRHSEVWKVGEAVITVGKDSTTIPFRYRYDFNIELADSQPIDDCHNLVATPIPQKTESGASSTEQQTKAPETCFPQTGWTPPNLKNNGEWVYDCLSSGDGNWVGQDEAWKATNWKKGSSQSEIVSIVVPPGAHKMGLGCDPCTVSKPDGTSISSPSGSTFGSFKPNISFDVNPGEVYRVKIFGGNTCPSRQSVIPPCSPEIYIWFNLP